MKRIVFWLIVITALIIVALFSSMSRSDEGFAIPFNVNNEGDNDVTKYETKSDDAGGGNAYYLDRHGLECPAGQAMTGFHLQRDGNNWHIDYKCKKVAGLADFYNNVDDLKSTKKTIDKINADIDKLNTGPVFQKDQYYTKIDVDKAIDAKCRI